MRWVVLALALTGCSQADVPALDGDDTVVQNLPCLFICVSTITAADTDTEGSATVSQSTSAQGGTQ